MSEAFYVGKNVILQWLHDFLEVDIKKVEECSTGWIYVQILDALFPGKVPLHKVNFEAKTEYDYIRNFKVLQDVFTTENIAKPVDVNQLIKGKAMDNLEFLQWLKHYFDTKYDGQEYHAAEKRREAIKKYKEKLGVKRTSVADAERKKPTTATSSSLSTAPSSSAPFVTKPRPVKAVVSKPAPMERKQLQSTTGRQKPVPKPTPPRPVLANVDQFKRMKEELQEANSQIEHLEKERNFFYDKLRELEILCQDKPEEDVEFKKKVLEILYKVDENSEFQSPEVEQTFEAETEAIPAMTNGTDPNESF